MSRRDRVPRAVNASGDDTTASGPADLTPCAGADTAATNTVQQDVDVVSSFDYRVPDLNDGVDVTTGGLKAHLIAEKGSLRQAVTQQRTVAAASPLEIGYIDAGPRPATCPALRHVRGIVDGCPWWVSF